MTDETLRAFRAARTMNAFRTAAAAAVTEVVEAPAPTEVVEAECAECEATVDPGDGPLSASIVAAAAVATYPPEHFEEWDGGKENTPLQVTKDGRVFGMIAGDNCFRNGDTTQCFKYQRDPDPEFKNFHTASLTLDNGEVIRVGALTAGGLHASTTMTLQQQRQHRENSQTAWALVRAFEDSRGRLCVTGSVIPGLDPAFQARVAALPVSIERWPAPGIKGTTLTGALSVPVPAWPVT